MVKAKFLQRVLLAYWLVLAVPAAAEVTATIDRNPIMQGEAVTLTIRVSDQDGEPNLDGLGSDFRVLGQSTSSQVQYINGNLSKWKDWNIQLLPARTGRLTIPAIRVGNTATAPILLTVAEQSANSPKEAWIEFEVSPKSVWQGQQINVKVQLYYAASVRSGELSLPQIDAGVIEQIGDDQTEQLVKNGVRYNRLSRRYVVFPESVGDFRIQGPVFNGQAEASGRQPSRSFGGLFRSTRQVTAAVNDAVVRVRPAEPGADFWLPAQDVSLQASWADAGANGPVFKVGEPVTRVVTLTAYGLLATQLPDLEFDYGSLRAYPEAAEQETRGTTDGVIGIRHFRTAIIPQAAGGYVLPEQRVKWWDVNRGEWATATLPSERIEVQAAAPAPLAAVAAEPCEPVVSTPVASNGGEAMVCPEFTEPAVQGGVSRWWPLLTAVFACLWLITLALWLFSKRREEIAAPSSDQLSLKAAKAELLAAAERNDVEAAQKALAAVAAEAGLSVAAPAAVAAHVEQQALAAALVSLDEARYGSAAQWDGSLLVKALRDSDWPTARNTRRTEALPPLYPL